METIHDYVKRKLVEAGPGRWEAIAEQAGCRPSTPRKVVYERANPGVNTVQPLLDFFQAVDRGEAVLPEPVRRAA